MSMLRMARPVYNPSQGVASYFDANAKKEKIGKTFIVIRRMHDTAQEENEEGGVHS